MREADYIRQRIRVRLPAREATLADAAWIRVSSHESLACRSCGGDSAG